MVLERFRKHKIVFFLNHVVEHSNEYFFSHKTFKNKLPPVNFQMYVFESAKHHRSKLSIPHPKNKNIRIYKSFIQPKAFALTKQFWHVVWFFKLKPNVLTHNKRLAEKEN